MAMTLEEMYALLKGPWSAEQRAMPVSAAAWDYLGVTLTRSQADEIAEQIHRLMSLEK